MTSPDQTRADDDLAPPPPAVSTWLAVAGTLAELAFETDRNGHFTAFGPGKVLGYPPARLIGSPASAVLFPALSFDGAEDAAIAFNRIIAAVCTDCIGWQGTVRLSPANGSIGAYRLALAPRLTSNGQVAGTYGLLLSADAAAPEEPRPKVANRAGNMLDYDTGLWTAKTFAEETARRFDRLDVEELPGTVIFLGFSRAPHGLHAAIAIRLAEELRDIVRPTDILGRLDATTIALWCDGMDHLTGAERGARFCGKFPSILPGGTLISVGMATRWPNSGDDEQTMLDRASIALRIADLATERLTEPDAVGEWRVWQQD